MNILIVAKEDELIMELTKKLARIGINYTVVTNRQQDLEQAKEKPHSIILVDINDAVNMRQVADIPSKIGMTKNPSVMAMIPGAALGDIAEYSEIAEFIIKPCGINELFVRVQRLVKKVKNINYKKIIRSGDLVIDMVSCEVSLGGRLVELTFKEYELLRFLAASKGQVFSRDALLNRVWKYDYLGGERTVDVHIRRLRSKIEDIDHTFIETVRNIGYRFRKDI